VHVRRCREGEDVVGLARHERTRGEDEGDNELVVNVENERDDRVVSQGSVRLPSRRTATTCSLRDLSSSSYFPRK
jgi:hypothetical protein